MPEPRNTEDLLAAIRAEIATGRTVRVDALGVAGVVTRFCLQEGTIMLSASDALGLCEAVLEGEQLKRHVRRQLWSGRTPA